MILRAVIVICTVFIPLVVHAQGISETSVVGKEMNVKIVERDISPEAISEFTKNAKSTASDIRVLTAPQEIQIVKLGERRIVDDEKIETAMREERENINELREAIQINAIIMDILDAQKIDLPQVVGAKFIDDKKIEIYAFSAQDQ